MRKLKQWDEEKSVIEEGLRVIEGAEKWYKARLSAVTERVRFGVDPSTNSAATTEANQVNNTNNELKAQNKDSHII